MINLLTNKYVIIGVLIITLLLSTNYFIKKINSIQTKLEISRNNEKAHQKGIEIWRDRYGQEHAKSIMFAETVESFKKVNDSVTTRMLDLVEQQNIKLKSLERLAYTQTKISTILERDISIPTMPDTTIDLSTPHIKNILHLSPLRIASDISLENETLTTMTIKKEPVGLPKKTVVGKLFQKWFGKKHIVIEGETIQTNPLIETGNQKFIQFYKD